MIIMDMPNVFQAVGGLPAMEKSYLSQIERDQMADNTESGVTCSTPIDHAWGGNTGTWTWDWASSQLYHHVPPDSQSCCEPL